MELKERLKRQIEHNGGKNLLCFLTGNKKIYNEGNGCKNVIDNGLVELNIDELENYEIDYNLDYPNCSVPNIKIK